MPKTPDMLWFGKQICDLCHGDIHYDLYHGVVMGKHKWVVLCAECWCEHGIGLGLFRGQHYHRSDTRHLFGLVAGGDTENRRAEGPGLFL